MYLRMVSPAQTWVAKPGQEPWIHILCDCHHRPPGEGPVVQTVLSRDNHTLHWMVVPAPTPRSAAQAPTRSRP